MDVQFQNNSLSVSYQNKSYQLHPVWLRERLPGEEFFDVDTHQRLYEPSSIDLSLQIVDARLSDHLLNIEFNDGAKGSYNINNLLLEIDDEKNKRGPLPKRVLWNSTLNQFPEAQFEE